MTIREYNTITHLLFVWSFDEIGFMMGVITAAMAVISLERLGKPKLVQSGSRKWIAVIQRGKYGARILDGDWVKTGNAMRFC